MYTIGNKQKSTALGCLWLTAVGILTVAAIVFSADQLCAWDISRRLPEYPSATRIVETHNFLRIFAMGETRIIYQTQDSSEQVREWFRQLNLRLLDEGRFRGLAYIERWVEPDPDGGSMIYYVTRCGT